MVTVSVTAAPETVAMTCDPLLLLMAVRSEFASELVVLFCP
jgi:hypothetical protein